MGVRGWHYRRRASAGFLKTLGHCAALVCSGRHRLCSIRARSGGSDVVSSWCGTRMWKLSVRRGGLRGLSRGKSSGGHEFDSHRTQRNDFAKKINARGGRTIRRSGSGGELREGGVADVMVGGPEIGVQCLEAAVEAECKNITHLVGGRPMGRPPKVDNSLVRKRLRRWEKLCCCI